MNIRMATSCGFCFGVKRALELTLDAKKTYGEIATFGALIHNRDVVKQLSDQGINAIEDLNSSDAHTVVIRSHGVSKAFYEEADTLGINIVDGTCPFVKKIHRLVDIYSKDGSPVMIVGNAMHPEVIGIAGWCHGPVYIVNTLDALEQWEANCLKEGKEMPEQLLLVAQTTLQVSVWNTVFLALKDKIKTLVANNTICQATTERQTAADVLSRDVDCMLVIGGPHSSNSKKLFEICEKNCKNTFFIESELDLKVINLLNCDNIGITAGASTPDWIIDKIINQLKILNS